MKSSSKNIRYSIMVLMFAMFCSTAYAQEMGTTINSDPPGATITLDGDFKLSATTPCRLPDHISGKFELVAVMPGYESWKGDITILPGQKNHYSFDLSPKTRSKAALRSLFMPGWGQHYSGQKEKAFLLNIGTVSFAIGTILADSDFRRKRDDYNQAVIDLGNAASFEETELLRSDVIDKNRKAYDSETRRNALVLITAGLWVYNILDAVVFFPDRKLYFHQGSIPIQEARINPVFDGETIGLNLTASF
ncbi:MAG: PEGA domain-containing protein [candidate division Zixibacteria bacterium]|nr:PEGA domain-containing protein [candidate division Zixibacteria bacterium]